jgi:hypothetical protein
MKFGILGNCQVRELRECLVRLAPTHAFETIQVERLHCTDQDVLTRIVKMAASVDVLFAHSTAASVSRPEPQQALNQALALAQPRHVVTIPDILHAGFHPDCCVIDCNGVFLETAAYKYHSAIIAGAYLCKLPTRRVPALFNRFIYAGLGYLSGFELQDQILCQRFADLEFDAQPIVANSDVFMHCPNHPTIIALFELATQMVLRVGITPAQAEPPEDWMQKNALLWPVYAGLRGYTKETNALPEFLHGPRVISLEELIESSYATYSGHNMTMDNCNSPSVARATRFLADHVRS